MPVGDGSLHFGFALATFLMCSSDQCDALSGNVTSLNSTSQHVSCCGGETASQRRFALACQCQGTATAKCFNLSFLGLVVRGVYIPLLGLLVQKARGLIPSGDWQIEWPIINGMSVQLATCSVDSGVYGTSIPCRTCLGPKQKPSYFDRIHQYQVHCGSHPPLGKSLKLLTRSTGAGLVVFPCCRFAGSGLHVYPGYLHIPALQWLAGFKLHEFKSASILSQLHMNQMGALPRIVDIPQASGSSRPSPPPSWVVSMATCAGQQPRTDVHCRDCRDPSCLLGCLQEDSRSPSFPHQTRVVVGLVTCTPFDVGNECSGRPLLDVATRAVWQFACHKETVRELQVSWQNEPLPSPPRVLVGLDLSVPLGRRIAAQCQQEHARGHSLGSHWSSRPDFPLSLSLGVLRGLDLFSPIGFLTAGVCHDFNRPTCFQWLVGADLTAQQMSKTRRSFNCWLGFRVGEAKNPGPGMVAIETIFAITNPTAVLNKAQTLAEIGAHIILASETSATAYTQGVMSKQMRRHGYVSQWGHPVAPQQITARGEAKRGLSLGAAVFSKFPCRPALQEMPMEQVQSCRISECFVRIGQLEIKIITVYGWPMCGPDAAAKNNLLLAWAYNRATASRLPAMVGGDFNVLPQSLPAWNAFAQLGWVEAGDFVASALQVNLPPTCKGATRHDTLLLPPFLQQFLIGADVLTEACLFDAHSPMRLHFRFPRAGFEPYHWRLPKSFAEFGVQPEDIGLRYRDFGSSVGTALRTAEAAAAGSALSAWSAAVEQAVSCSLSNKAQAEPELGWPVTLPKAYRGRCVPRDRVVKVLPAVPRRAREGQPQPVAEATSVRSRHKLRQWRWLHDLLSGLRKLPRKTGPARQVLLSNLRKEWRAICHAPGYVPQFCL